MSCRARFAFTRRPLGQRVKSPFRAVPQLSAKCGSAFCEKCCRFSPFPLPLFFGTGGIKCFILLQEKQKGSIFVANPIT